MVPPVPRLCPVQVGHLVPKMCSCPWVLASLGKRVCVYYTSGSRGLPDVSYLRVHYGSCSRGFSKFMSIVGNVGKTDIFHDLFGGESWKMLVLPKISNNFYDSGNYGSGSRGFSKFMEAVGNVNKTNIFRDLSGRESLKMLVLRRFPTVSMIPETTVPAPDVSPNSCKMSEMLVKPIFSMICLGGTMENVSLYQHFQQFP